MHKRARERHSHLINDQLRTAPLIRAVKKAVSPGDVVVEVGAGLGLLSIAAAKSGAKIVYAIDYDREALKEAAAEARREGVSRKIVFINDISFNVKLPEKADLLICETVGSFAFEENILVSISDAKKRFLKPSGKIIPEKLELWGTLCSYRPRMDPVSDIACVDKEKLMSLPTLVSTVIFSRNIPRSIHKTISFKCNRETTVKSIVLWPEITWKGRGLTSASPFCGVTHWKQGVLPIEPRRALPGKVYQVELIIRPDPRDPQMLTERLWRWRD